MTSSRSSSTWIGTFLLVVGCLAFSGFSTPSGVSAQDDEFDDFDDAFEDDEPEEDTSDDSEDDGFDDLEDDAFDDTDDGLEEGDLEDDGLGVDDEDEAPPAAAGPAPTDEAAARAYRERRHIMHNSWLGSVGGVHVVDAGSGAAGAFRAQLGINFFLVDGWLTLPDAPITAGTQHSHVGGSLSLSWNPWDFLEIYASLASWADSNEQENPALFQVLGDTLLGVKGYYHFEDVPILTVGGDLSVGFLNTVGDIGLVGESTSVGLRGNLTVDLRELEDRIPFIARLNLGYWFDNSANLIQGVERARYNALANPEPCPEDPAVGNCFENRHLLTRVERYSLQINRLDSFRIGIGLEAPLQVMEGFHINPMVEYVVDIPVNRQGFSCLEPVGVGDDTCMDLAPGDATPMFLTLGVRATPPIRGMNIFLAVDIGLTGTNTFVRELAALEPYNVRFGFGWAFDTQPQIQVEEREVIRNVVGEAPEPDPVGRIVGLAVEQGTETPIAGAVVSFPGRELTSLSSAPDGRFTSYSLEPGEVALALSHPEYNDGTCAGTIPEEGGDVEVRCELVALPRLGSVRGTVSSDGSPVGGAIVKLTGASNRSITTAPDGVFTASDLPPGTYTARVEAENYLIRVDSFDVAAREQAQPQIDLIARPRRSLVRVSRRQITIRRQVNFATDSADILPNSTELLSEVADVIIRHPEITRIEIQGHTDDRGGRSHNQDLSQRRSEAVRDWLVRAGVEANRLEAHGFGQDDPLVPNITASNRARNRRVQFFIREQTEAAE